MENGTRSFFVTTVGTGKYQEVAYTWEVGAHSTPYAPEASARALLQKDASWEGAQARILVTEEARKAHGDELSSRLEALGFVPEMVSIAPGRDEAELFQLLSDLGERIPEGVRLAADVTHSFRHLSFAWLAALLYLQELKNVQIEKVTYGAFEMREGVRCPLLDLTPTLHFVRGFHAARSAIREGDFRELSLWMRDWARHFHFRNDTVRREQVNNWLKAAAPLAEAYHRGLPLEVGLNARHLLENACSLDEMMAEHPLTLLVGRVRPVLEELAVPSGPEKKEELLLTQEELERQLRLIAFYREQGNVGRCLRLLREWLVSWVMWKQDHADGWLDRAQRQKAEHFLQAWSFRAEKGLALGTQAAALPWKAVADLRNALAHAGHTTTPLDGPQQFQGKIQDYLKQCQWLLDAPTPLPAFRESGKRLLMTPLGLSPGPLFTLLSSPEERPDTLVVFTSREGAERLPEIQERSHWQGQVILRVLKDPFGAATDQSEQSQEADTELLRALAASSRLTVNWTGGTAYMAWVLRRWAQQAERLGIPVLHVLLVDRRSAKEQQSDPWRPGEIRIFPEDGHGDRMERNPEPAG